MKELNTRLRNQVAEQKIKIDDMEKQIITQNEDRVELTTGTLILNTRRGVWLDLLIKELNQFFQI